MALLDVHGLSVAFPGETTQIEVVHGLDLSVETGHTVAIVGESGSGKSVTALAITRLLDHAGGRIVGGSIEFTDRAGRLRDLACESPEAMRELRGLTKLSRDEMRLAGYPDTTPEIDVCAGIR